MQLTTGRTLSVTPSIGLVRLADVGREASDVLQDADMAMLQAKTRGRGRVAIFDAGLREEVGNRLELEHDLRAAVENGELRLEYQPLASLANGRVLGLEALVRWEHPRRGLLLPGRFVALAEESELIVALGGWVLEAGCAQMARWRAMYPEANDSFLAVNVSPRQLDGPAAPAGPAQGPGEERPARRARSCSRSPSRASSPTTCASTACSTSCASSASGSPSTTSAPGTRRSAT